MQNMNKSKQKERLHLLSSPPWKLIIFIYTQSQASLIVNEKNLYTNGHHHRVLRHTF